MSEFVDPRGIPSFRDWADYMYPTLQQYGTIAQAMSDDEWQQWGAGLLALNGLAALNVPNPYQFDDWKTWAMRFIELVDSGGGIS